MRYYYQEFTRKLPVFDPEPGSGNYQEATMNPPHPFCRRSVRRNGIVFRVVFASYCKCPTLGASWRTRPERLGGVRCPRHPSAAGHQKPHGAWVRSTYLALRFHEKVLNGGPSSQRFLKFHAFKKSLRCASSKTKRSRALLASVLVKDFWLV
jgi:hypothetical protein